MLRSALTALGLVVAGCGGTSGGGNGSCANQGIIWLSWTIEQQPPSPTSCQGIDHLRLQLFTSCGNVEIEPIPCLRGLGWEYDGLPEGDATVYLDGIDARGAIALTSLGSTTLGTTRAATPTPLDLTRTSRAAPLAP